MKYFIILLLIVTFSGCSGKGFSINNYNYSNIKEKQDKYIVEIYK